MFDLRKFVMDTLCGMVGNYPEFQIREYALNWYAKGKLTEEDLAEVESWFALEEIPAELPAEILANMTAETIEG